MENNNIIQSHYAREAKEHNDSAQSTMSDTVIRNKELELISAFIKKFSINVPKFGKVLEIGPGNGYTLSQITQYNHDLLFFGIEYTKELFEIAQGRKLERVQLIEGDARDIEFPTEEFDLIYSERCLINILDKDGQYKALQEIYRVLKSGGYFLMIECFEDGLVNNNRARSECGLSSIDSAYHNLYFNKAEFEKFTYGKFDVLDHFVQEGVEYNYNFLSSHYFFSRVLHPLVSKGEQTKNTEFVKFFSNFPSYGNYSPIQAFVLKKK